MSDYVEDKILDILSRLPSEGACFDYKQFPYLKNEDHKFVKDVDAMLNSIEGVGKDKFIILGVEDKSKLLKGIKKELLRDDNEFQNLLMRIKPRPFVQTGMVSFNNMDFGYVYISKINQEYVYEIATLFKECATEINPYKDVLFPGAAFTRYGSKNDVLDDAGRRKLYALKVQAENTTPIRPLQLKNRNKEENVFALLGSWNEKYSGDIAIIEQMTGRDYKSSQELFKDEMISNTESFSYVRNIWNCYSRKNLLHSISNKLFDEDIDMFFSVANSILDSIDNYAKDAQEGLFPEPINYFSNSKYSAEIIKGVFETIAILGNNEFSFSNCTKNHISNQIWEMERRTFSCSNARSYYILSEYFQYLGEAQPKTFLYEIDKLIKEKSEPFIEFLKFENESKHVYKGYYHLDRIIRCLAVDERHFASAINIIVQLAQFDSRFIDTAVYILLPWYPQTHASINKRIAIIRSLATTNKEIIWDILMKLMPGKTTSSISLEKPEFMEEFELPGKTSNADYIKASMEYINVAINLLENSVQRIVEIVDVISHVSFDIQDQIVKAIIKNTLDLSLPEKEAVWNCIRELVQEHRRFSNADWALPADRLEALENAMAVIIPNANYLEVIRLFRKDQFSLFDDFENYEEETHKLRDKQIAAVNTIYKEKGLSGLNDLNSQVENHSLLGDCVAKIATDEDITLLLKGKSVFNIESLLYGITNGLKTDHLFELIELFSDDSKAEILSNLPLSKECVSKIQTLEEKSQDLFWKITCGHYSSNIDASTLEIVIKRLNECGRANTSLNILLLAEHANKEFVSDQLIIESLDSYDGSDDKLLVGRYTIQELIKRMQRGDIHNEDLIRIEWKYLDFLKSSDGYSPVTIWKEMANNPDFFMKILKQYRGDPDNKTEDSIEAAKKSFRVLYHWKLVPGLQDNGTIDVEKLDNWIEAVKIEASKCGLLRLAQEEFGKVAFYSPQDPDGFFINRRIAYYLQNETAEGVRVGYSVEAFNSRGAHWVDPTGKPEFELEEKYNNMANAADEEGMFRFANTLREIAQTYHDEAIDNISHGR